ncbi:MAG: crossover junction endodeoxyribonuclease RuvC [Candidatus Magasanikbacteria bacterium]|nr:crossover junction endodeoxyribonuclease RuvC [Candidatus Magasanikbacteria bacterium]
MLKIISPTPPKNLERILGIDPGFGRLGFGVVEQGGVNDWKAIAYGCIETSPKKKFVERLKEIRDEIEKIIKKYRPTRLAVEQLFFFNNAKTAMDVGQARGVVLLVGIQHNLPIDELTPLQVKQALTGYGRAEKQQMQKVVAMVLGLKEKIKSDDAADALAVAITAGQSLWLTSLSPGERGRG